MSASLKNNRTKKIDARFTEEEYKLVEEMERTLGLSKTDLVRSKLLYNSSKMIINAKELIVQIDRIGTELGRAGNNINQLARHANTLNKREQLTPVVVERFNRLMAAYLEIQKGLEATLRKLIHLLGN